MKNLDLIIKCQDIKEYVVLDFETTGFAPGPYVKILEIGASKIKNGEIVGIFEELVDPKVNIPKKITELTGISQQMIAGKRAIGPVMNDFMVFTEGLPIVAHNAPFEKRFLTYNLSRMGRVFDNEMIDTMALCKALLPTKSNKLGSVAEFFGITITNAHRAMGDVIATELVFKELIKKANEIKFDVDVSILPKLENQKIEYPALEIVKDMYWKKDTDSGTIERVYFETQKGKVFFDFNSFIWNFKSPDADQDQILEIAMGIKKTLGINESGLIQKYRN